MWGYDALRRHLDAQFKALNERINLMPTRADFDAAKAGLQQAITDAVSRVTTDIQSLRDQLAAGNPVTDQDLADLQTDTQQLAQLDQHAPPTP